MKWRWGVQRSAFHGLTLNLPLIQMVLPSSSVILMTVNNCLKVDFLDFCGTEHNSTTCCCKKKKPYRMVWKSNQPYYSMSIDWHSQCQSCQAKSLWTFLQSWNSTIVLDVFPLTGTKGVTQNSNAPCTKQDPCKVWCGRTGTNCTGLHLWPHPHLTLLGCTGKPMEHQAFLFNISAWGP